MNVLLRLFSIGFAGFTGTLLRYWLSGVIARRYGETLLDGLVADGLVTLERVRVVHYRGST
jgi:hypothetical protein